ncbi:MAG: phosphatidate cytidylyltransferase [Pseudomonadota bacterium]
MRNPWIKRLETSWGGNDASDRLAISSKRVLAPFKQHLNNHYINNMLLNRVITALVLAPLAVLGVLKLPESGFAVAWGVIILIAAWEWANLSEANGIKTRLFFLAALVASSVVAWYWPYLLEDLGERLEWHEISEFSGALDWLAVPAVIWWLFVMLAVRKTGDNLLKLKLKTGVKLFLGWFILLLAWIFLVRLRNFYGSELVLYFLLLIWLADIAAYFAGRLFGKNKLAPHISPAKTMEGMYGALLGAVVAAVAAGLYYEFKLIIIADFILLSLVTVQVSIYGDLFESLAKRIRGVKDSGAILPGHGGVLDRIDSLIAAIPVFYAGIILIRGQFG